MNREKSIDILRKMLLIVISIIILCRIGYILFRGELNKEYYTSAEYDLTETTSVDCNGVSQYFSSDQKRLDSVEIIATNIADDRQGALIMKILDEDSIVYQTNISLSNINDFEWKKIYINLELDSETKYKIVFSSSKDCTQIPKLLVVNSSFANEIISSFDSDGKEIDGQIVVNYGYKKVPGVIERTVNSSLWVILWILLVAFILHWNEIKKYFAKVKSLIIKNVGEVYAYTAFEILACFLILDCSGIDFQNATKIVLLIVSIIAISNYKIKKEEINRLVGNSIWKKCIIVLVYLYAAFALVGQRIFIYPLDKTINTAGFFVFVVTAAWFKPVVDSLIFYYEKASENSFEKDKKLKTHMFLIICLILLLFPATYNLYANNPGISSPDTQATMIENAQHLRGMHDWHPFFYSLVLHVIEKISNTTYAVIFVQYFFWAYVLLELLLYLRKKGIKDGILICCALFLGINAGNFLHINTIWKDIPYTLSILWVFIIFSKLSFDYKEYKKKWWVYLELIVALVGTYLYRKNGMVSFVIIVIAMLIVLRKNVKVWISLGLSLAIIFTIKVPLYNYFEVQSPGRTGMYIGLGQDVLGAYYAGGEVSQDTLEMITMMTSYNNAEYAYTPTYSEALYDVDVEPKRFVFNYIDTFIKNPVLMTRAIIDREDALWDIYAGQDSRLDCMGFYYTQDGQGAWNDYYPSREYVSLYNEMLAATNYTVNTQWINAIEWRSGLFTLLGVILIVLLVIRNGKKRYLLLISPLVGHVMSLLLSTGWSDFRYFWPMNLMNFTFLILGLLFLNKQVNENI